MVVRSLGELLKFVRDGYKPYYHRGVCRWYLRKGSKRLLIDKELEGVAEEIHLKFKELRSEERMLRDELIKEAIELRASGLTITEVIKLTGIPKSTLYRKLP
jgi:DNA invertase Pin-like site-specific DNA recombinase